MDSGKMSEFSKKDGMPHFMPLSLLLCMLLSIEFKLIQKPKGKLGFPLKLKLQQHTISYHYF